MSRRTALTALTALTTLAPGLAAANDRAFAYTYESATLPEGAKELEFWTTGRYGRDLGPKDGDFRRYDQRIEVEVGLTDRLMGAFYVNAETIHTRTTGTASVLTGVSAELKYRHLDAAADAVGLASYLELTGGPDEGEVEAKLIVDKQLDGLLLASNLVLEEEVEDLGGENEIEHKFELDLGGAFELGEHVTLGVEVRAAGVVAEGELEGIALFAGPAFGLRSKAAWMVLGITPQIGAFGGESSGFERDLVHNEKAQGRLLVGFDL
jgi:hypothetical protein